jgi:HEAT repeat protein
MLQSPRLDDVIRAAQALGDIGDQRATEALVTVFRNPLISDDIRLACAEALLRLKSAPAVVTLLAALRKQNWRVRHNAAAVLGQLKATWATEPLVKALSDEHASVRQTAAGALARFNTPRARKALEDFKAREALGKTAPLPDLPKPEAAEATVALPSDGGEQPLRSQVAVASLAPAMAVALSAETGLDEERPAAPTVGEANDKDDTLTRYSTADVLRALHRRQVEEVVSSEAETSPAANNSLSPAMAAAEAALNQLSLESSAGEPVFQEQEEESEAATSAVSDTPPAAPTGDSPPPPETE